jgi:hypothetical protein
MYTTLMRHGMLVLCSKMFAGLIANEQYIPAESLSDNEKVSFLKARRW